ncbi:MAG: IscS subfamily cysteine desulfurase [Rhodospirillales bacterium]|nr:IscS subfamily cysteine desulfurase [Rhodospirillales bacterium]MBO6785861.1 IscS subfamily cysteine desulfurase [Rhodospirillales bacterium]
MTAQARPIYLDYQATTPVDARVMETMTPFFTEAFGNPHSTSHAYGWEARDAVEAARQQVAAMINADPREVVFTSGATESNNMAIKGVARFFEGRKGHMIAPVTEHKCVLESMKYAQKLGYEITWLPVAADGLIDPAAVKDAIREDTALVSVMQVNNEIGTIQPVAEIGAICREAGVYFHTDAAQASGKAKIDVVEMNADLLSLSAHKMYGPMGIGALYVRRKPRVRLEPLMDGGGQERTMRSGTLPAPLVVGFGKAAEIVTAERDTEETRVRDLRDRLLKGLQQRVPDLYVNGSMEHRVAGNLNVGFKGIDSEALMDALKERVAISSGSACTSAAVEPSYVLRALGLSDEDAHASVRLCVGRMTTADEIEVAIDAISDAVRTLRADGAQVSVA